MNLFKRRKLRYINKLFKNSKIVITDAKQEVLKQKEGGRIIKEIKSSR